MKGILCATRVATVIQLHFFYRLVLSRATFQGSTRIFPEGRNLLQEKGNKYFLEGIKAYTMSCQM